MNISQEIENIIKLYKSTGTDLQFKIKYNDCISISFRDNVLVISNGKKIKSVEMNNPNANAIVFEAEIF